jgi:predicted transcriptional regulator
MGTNYKLKGKIVEAGLTEGKTAEMIGIDYKTMSNKINGKTDFKQSEINQILSILNERGVTCSYEDIF